MSDRRQRQKEQRAAKREAERKQESRRALLRTIGTALVFGVIVIAVLALSGTFAGEDPSDIPASYEDFRDQETACDAEAPPPEEVMAFDAPERQTDITQDSTVNATIETSCGEIVIDLNTDGAPGTANSFVFLAREGFYDGMVIHRIVQEFVLQTGDPAANGTGGPGYLVEDEFPGDDFVYEEGVVYMANRGSRSTGSQFAVVVGDDGQFLTNNFNVLGTVTSGQETIDQIMEIPTATSPGTVERSLPLETVYIESITIDVADS
jgi:cyclophilin family peptidyl-prolyl cis-trans isomerase